MDEKIFWTGATARTHAHYIFAAALFAALPVFASPAIGGAIPQVSVQGPVAPRTTHIVRPLAFRAEPPQRRYEVTAPIRSNVGKGRPKISGPADASLPLVVIDAGHGGHDPGAISPHGGQLEKEVTLAIAKAVRDGSRFDIVSSLLILVGYAIPGFVMGVLLLVVFGGGSFLQLFPLRGLVSDNWESLSWASKVMDYLWHMVLPITASVIGNFAMITMLTKNSFLEEIRKQYVTTARAKGLNENQVLWKHVFRNAMLPLLTGFPAAFIGAFFAGSLLIETLFSLDGLGLMSFEAVMRRDYPVVFGTLYIFTLIGLFTKLISDIAYVLVDPRIQFGSEGS